MSRACFFIFVVLGLAAGRVPGAESNAAPLAAASVLETNIINLRVAAAAVGLDAALGAALTELPGTNRFIGTVLDLRYAGGTADAVVAPVVQRISAQKRPLAILVNGQTSGAAAELARALRAARLGLIFGGETAGIAPDITVAVAAADEKIYFADAFAVMTNRPVVSATNLLSRETNRPLPRISEADLVRARRSGAADPEAELDALGPAESRPERNVVQDPVLARALDLLKALAVVQNRRLK